MFCDGCGNEIQVNQRYCSSCGKPAKIALMPQSESKVARHTHLLGILWLVVSAFNLIGAGVLAILSVTIFGSGMRMQPTPEFPGGFGFLHLLFTFLSALVFIKAMAGFAVGIGLLQREPWARPLALVFGFLALLSVPFGTALGVYTIWVLMSQGADKEYERLSAAAA